MLDDHCEGPFLFLQINALDIDPLLLLSRLSGTIGLTATSQLTNVHKIQPLLPNPALVSLLRLD
jgi:hypothetical protein